MNKKGFTLIELLVVISLIGILSLLGLRLYLGEQKKAKETLVNANASTLHTLIQAELAGKNLSLEEVITEIAPKAGLFNPFNHTPLNKPGDFPQNDENLIPGRIKIILTQETFYIQVYGEDRLLSTFTAKR
ncbi:MAG: hypothetical protein Kow00103_05550 [Candidatus Caldatribacteriota bacterium]